MDTLITMWLTMLMLIILAYVTTRKISVVPGRLQVMNESIIQYFTQIAESSMGKTEAQRHLPLILTLFMFILTANLVGQLPWHLIRLHSGELASPNNDINMTAAMAIVVSLYYIYYKDVSLLDIKCNTETEIYASILIFVEISIA